MYTKIAFVASLAAVAQAQIAGISSNCTNGIVGLATDPNISQCIAFNGLVGLATLGQNDSVVPAIEAWQSQLCAAPACDNATLISAVNNVLASCAGDFSSYGLTVDASDPSVSAIVQKVPAIVAAVKRLLCLRDTSSTNSATSSNGLCTAGVSFCDIELMNTVQTAIGQNISLSLLTGLQQDTSSQLNQLVQALAAVPNNEICTACNTALYQVLNESLSDLAQVNLDNAQISGTPIPTAIDSKCGSGYLSSPFMSNGTVTEQSSYCAASSAPSSAARLRLRRWN